MTGPEEEARREKFEKLIEDFKKDLMQHVQGREAEKDEAKVEAAALAKAVNEYVNTEEL